MSELRRKRTLAKLGEVSHKIERLLAGQNVTLADLSLPGEGDAAPTPLERLRAFKDLLNQTLAELRQGEPRRCHTCARQLPALALDEMPWAFACPADASECVPPA